MARRLAVGTLGGVLAALLVPSVASAHGLILRTDLPIPQWLFAWAAAVVLVVSFVALATLWPVPRLGALRDRRFVRLPVWIEPICGALGIAAFVLVVYSGIAGSQLYFYNLAPTWIYVIFWVGLAFASILFGDAFRAFNPWRAFARAVAWGARRARRGRPGAEAVVYPPWLGRWPAVLGLLGFAWLELIYVNRDQPNLLAFLSLAYAAVQLVGMSLYGIDVWSERADTFSVFFGLIGRMAPLRWERAPGARWVEVRLQAPFIGAIGLDLVPGTLAMAIVMIGTTSFDGFSNGSLWLNQNGLFLDIQNLFLNIGFGNIAADELTGTVGLVGMVGVISGLYAIGIRGMRSLDAAHGGRELAERFAHTLLPIAVAYFVAHYFSLIAISGQLIVPLLSDPLGNGSNLFGTANDQVNYGAITGNLVWYVQVAALITGHLAALTLAHDRALTIYKRAQDAARSQYWMLTVMVAYTSLGLWILSSAY
jgi:hypothetical protein